MKGFILAGGFGTRLWPLTEDRTKAAIPFLGRPLINYAVEYLASHGVRDIIVNLHHKPDSIRLALGDGSELGANISYSFEEQILGTSGALDRVRDSLLDDDFVVVNGKIVTDIDLGKAIADHRKQNAMATLVLRENTAREHFSIVEVDDRGWITSFAGFPDAEASQAATADAAAELRSVTAKPEPAPLMFTGIQVLSSRIFDYIPRDRFSHSTIHVYPQAIEAGEPVIAHVSAADWYEMSTLARYLEASLRFARKKGQSVIEGEGCAIENGASVEDAVLWDDVKVESGARINRAVLGEGVQIRTGRLIEQAVVVRRDIVREIERGEILDDNVVVPI